MKVFYTLVVVFIITRLMSVKFIIGSYIYYLLYLD